MKAKPQNDLDKAAVKPALIERDRQALSPARRVWRDRARGNSLPGWQIERARILQRACLSVQGRLQRGEKARRVFPTVARRYHGRPFKSDPKRRLALAKSTLWHLFRAWKRAGELPVAFKLNYRPRRREIPAPLLCRFVEFCAANRLASVKSAWEKFAARGGSYGRGQHASKRLAISYQQIIYSFPASAFHQMQAQLKAMDAAQKRLAEIKVQAIADIRARLPDRPARQRVKRENDFQI